MLFELDLYVVFVDFLLQAGFIESLSGRNCFRDDKRLVSKDNGLEPF